ncbi:DUF2057 family protein [Vibrio lamellibrachiae]|uniref:YccT family protein n=1 Tax=Vibrio lamellibrachiae TaxID=2910253 RepID=UPI003D0BB534
MKLKQVLLGSAVFISMSAFADVTLNLPKDVQLLVINGEDAGYSSFGFDYKENITIPNGVNQVVFRLSKVVNDGGNKMTKFKSKPLVATFDSRDSSLSLDVPNVKTLSAGYRFNGTPTFDIVAREGTVEFLEKNRLNLLSSFGSDFIQATENFNKSSEVASLAHYKVSPQQSNDMKSIKQVETYKELEKGIGSTVNEFSKLSKEQKQEFLSWAINNI